MKTETKQEFPCTRPGCENREPFKNEKALNMHTARVHTKTIKAPFQGMSKEEKRLKKRRIYQKKLRKRYKAEGKDSRGYPLKGRRTKKFGAPWTVERRKKFNKTWEDKKNGAAPTQEQIEDPRYYINHCPSCGEHLVPYYLAAGIALKRRVE